MRRLLAFAWFLACLPVTAQVTPLTYPYLKPRPMSGTTPDWMIRWSTTIGPSAHNNENPLIWSTDVAGGLQSRLNAGDRLNMQTNWTQEGAIVYDASDRTYYGVDTNLLANKRLFSIDFTYSDAAQVTNVAQLITVPCGISGRFARAVTQGYYDSSDGGGGFYYSHPYSPGLTNMGHFQSTYNPAFMWSLLMPRDGIYLRQYGAKGDGVTDDTQSFRDWLHDINNLIGLVGVGTYLIAPTTIEAGAILNIRGTAQFGLFSAIESGGMSFGNSGKLLRKPTPGQENNSLLLSANDSSLNLFNLILDGNQANEPTATNAYLYEVNGGKVTEIDSCLFMNSAGHGMYLVGGGANWSVIRNSRFNDLNYGLVLTNIFGAILDVLKIQKCKADCLLLAGYSTSTHANNLLLTDSGRNGITLHGAHTRFSIATGTVLTAR
jgi:hypothetical protein